MAKQKNTRRKRKISDNEIRAFRTERRTKVLITLLRCTLGVFVAYYAYQSIAAVAGKTTLFLTVIDLLAHMDVNKWVAWLIVVITGTGWFFERRSRKMHIKRQHPRVKSLEEQIWKERSSSGIGRDGETPKE